MIATEADLDTRGFSPRTYFAIISRLKLRNIDAYTRTGELDLRVRGPVANILGQFGHDTTWRDAEALERETQGHAFSGT